MGGYKMRTRTRGDYWLRGLCVGALSAASMALLGLSLAQQSPTKLATADSPLSSSARTALGGLHDGGAAKSGSSDHGSMEMVVVNPDFSDSFENDTFQSSQVNIKVARARYLAGRLGKLEWSKGKPPVDIDDDTKRSLEDQLGQITLTDDEKAMVYEEEDFVDWATFDYNNHESEPTPEDEVVKRIGVDESNYIKLLEALFTNLEYITQRHLQIEGKSGTVWVNRPITMLALFRANSFTRLMVFTLPYMIDKIAAHFLFDANTYRFDIVKALPELQKGHPSSMPFTYVRASEDKLAYAEVKHGEEIVVTRDDQLETELSHVSNFEELSQLIKCLHQEAKIPSAHKLVVAHVILLDLITKAEKTVVLSDVGVMKSLAEDFSASSVVFELDSNNKIICVDAIFVDGKYSHLMKTHIVDAFNLLDNPRILDNYLIDKSVSFLDNMKAGILAVANQ